VRRNLSSRQSFHRILSTLPLQALASASHQGELDTIRIFELDFCDLATERDWQRWRSTERGKLYQLVFVSAWQVS